MKVIKRNKTMVDFDGEKVRNAIFKANQESKTLTDVGCERVVQAILNKIENNSQDMEVEQIQDLIESSLADMGFYRISRDYIRYRYKKELLRKSNTTDASIKELLDGNSDYWNNENSNKNAKRTTVQRDYMAGIVSTDITRRFLLEKDIVEAHDAGLIHFHDADYFAQMALHNCELINLEDMLQNGTVVNGVMIEKPHKLLTATTIATQIIAAVTSSSYGGATITLTHLAPFVRMSKDAYMQKYMRRGFDTDTAYQYAMEDLYKEIEDAVQTFNYQTNSMTNTNGWEIGRYKTL